MTRCTLRTLASAFLPLAVSLALPVDAQTLPPTYPGDAWETRTPAELGLDPVKVAEAQAYSLTKNGAGLIVRNGYVVASWGTITDRYPVYSVTKGIGAVLLGIANQRSDIGVQLTDKAQTLYPDFGNVPADNASTGFLDDVTVEQLATHSSGFEKDRTAPRLKFEPGTRWLYSDGGANWLADILTYKFNEDLMLLLERDVLTPLSLQLRRPGTTGDVEWRSVTVPEGSPRNTTIGSIPRREFNAGLSLNVDAMARFGLLMERGGNWNGTQLLSADFVNRIGTPAPGIAGLPIIDTGGAPHDSIYPNATAHHGLFWWNNADGTLPNVPRDAFWAWGLGDHLIVVIPSLDIVAVRTSAQGTEGDARLQYAPWSTDPACQNQMCTNYQVLDGFLTPIAQSVLAAPTVSLTSDVTTVPVGGTATLTWSSTLATSCTASGGWSGAKATTGTEAITVNATATYTLACTGASGTTESSVTVTANNPPPPAAPTVTLTSNVASVNTGGTVTLTWSSTNADSCAASGGWTGAKAASGNENLTVNATSTYTLACTGAGGTTQQSVTVTATTPPSNGGGGGGGGGGALQWWMLAGLLLAGGARRARRRLLDA